ncbi:hypothetical protein E2C01_057057 [Portunus trituberculatus]|uniref:Uncharacterized protein n=1 Tax=Portunus trituberculatus TaxID=210409 RepID=A0A5B7H015_PORTR|nr:hypothetical protein [Portunus trituberculatus]
MFARRPEKKALKKRGKLNACKKVKEKKRKRRKNNKKTEEIKGKKEKKEKDVDKERRKKNHSFVYFLSSFATTDEVTDGVSRNNNRQTITYTS